MTIRTTLIASSLIAASLVSGAAHAALQGRDLNGSAGSFEAYYDTDLNITWLATSNTATYWMAADTWAANLSFTDGVHVYDNWRLPAHLSDASCDTDNYNCTGSEMGHLFYSELGGTARQSILTSVDPDLAKFTNLQANRYWSDAGFAPDFYLGPYFDMRNGSQYVDYSGNAFYALAVSTGDVGAVPEADTWAMLLAGLGLVGAATRRRRG